MEVERRHASWRPSLRVVVAYAVFVTAWILGSDAVVAAFVSDPEEITRLQSLKGIGFVVVTAGLLYLLIKRVIESTQLFYEGLAEREASLSLLLEQIPASVWTTDLDLTITSARGRGIARPRMEASSFVGTKVGQTPGSEVPHLPSVEAHRRALEGQEASFRFESGGETVEARVMPLRDTAGQIIGCLGFGLDVTERVNSERERSQTLKRLQKLNKERETLFGHLVRAEEAERKRIAEGIHDDSIQVMTSAGMALDLLIGRLSEPGDVELAQRSRDLVSDAIGRLRTLVFHLRPLALDEAGLAAATRLLLKKSSVETGLEFTLSDESSVPLEGPKLYVTYQIIQEAIANIRNHSGAHRVDVTFRDCTDGLRIRLEDDGSGFDPDRAPEQGHFGLTDMRERAAVVGGTCNVTTSPEGTSIDLWVPWAERPVAQTVST